MEYCSLETAKAMVKAQFEKAFQLPLYNGKLDYPTIEWKPMGVHKAGYATYSTNTITLNTNYLHSKSWKEFLEDTPLHELAHLLAHKLYFSTGHDRSWKYVCYSLGLQGNRCHSFSTPEDTKIIHRHQERHTVYCNCREHQLSTCRYKRMLSGEVYRCTLCKGKLRLNP